VLLYDAGALHEHTAGAACQVQHRAPLGVKHVRDKRDQRDGRDELAAVVRLLASELGEEVLVDTAEDVTFDLCQLVGIERP
jgi:hypothetical protein